MYWKRRHNVASRVPPNIDTTLLWRFYDISGTSIQRIKGNDSLSLRVTSRHSSYVVRMKIPLKPIFTFENELQPESFDFIRCLYPSIWVLNHGSRTFALLWFAVIHPYLLVSSTSTDTSRRPSLPWQEDPEWQWTHELARSTHSKWRFKKKDTENKRKKRDGQVTPEERNLLVLI